MIASDRTNLLLLGGAAIAGLLLLGATSQATPTKAESKDCFRRAAELIEANLGYVGPGQLQDMADKWRTRGNGALADCLERMAAGQTQSCRDLLIGPLAANLSLADPSALRQLATAMRMIKTSQANKAADCLDAEATKRDTIEA